MASKVIKKTNPTIVFIFGGSGDLNHRKLTPALYNLYVDGFLNDQFKVYGLGRTDYTDKKYRDHLLEGIQLFSRRKDDGKGPWKEFSEKVHYLKMDAGAGTAEEYSILDKAIQETEKEWKVEADVLYYLSVGPNLFPIIAKGISTIKSSHKEDKTRIVIEKPFGHDLQTAMDLNKLLAGLFQEDQIYRIDHYLGKETVQNILALRFANTLFEPIWNNKYIDHVQITAAETVGVEDRGGYYDTSGALRDMIQNHILQVLCMVAMEAPVSFDANEIRNKKTDVLKAIKRYTNEEVKENVVRGQYGAGWMKGSKVNAYREEKGVDPNSATETYAAVKFQIDNWRWQGVPFYVRSGKYLAEKTTLITIHFKQAPNYAFPAEAVDAWRPNRLTLTIQPENDVRLLFQAKRPGQTMSLNPVEMVFNYADAYNEPQPEAYETLLLDAMMGNSTQFMRNDQVEIAWKVVMPILDSWNSKVPVSFPNYSPGSWGPEEADALIAKDGRSWTNSPTKSSKDKL
ncbi:glucose-6-phosphate dehydrogenase [Rhizosphaericola mali]|uniref:Glucose-6-phosphate 1-dehydrogenase n=1 Tax=Rhizosphaericola mali TaxID=2545455 RepID=A0A5P2G6U0_9BACT|nr:glucose-6-phosphate dehydrogenase [Rhizosphaericola mali]QES90418.1 glucose-6-phosphate dehydrogenase [Rhizosphaericola mali]